MKTDQDKLALWQERLSKNLAAYQDDREEMTALERLYAGSRDIDGNINSKSTGKVKKASYVRNVVAEIVLMSWLFGISSPLNQRNTNSPVVNARSLPESLTK